MVSKILPAYQHGYKVHANTGRKRIYSGGKRPGSGLARAEIPDALPIEYEHGPDCWRSPLHHDCAVALIERLQKQMK